MYEYKGVKNLNIDIYKALSDESRLRIMNILMQKELCVCEIEVTLDMSQSNVSRHLIKLKNVGMVESKKESQWAYYSINKNFIEDNYHLYNHLKISFSTDIQFNEDVSKLNSIAPQKDICARKV